MTTRRPEPTKHGSAAFEPVEGPMRYVLMVVAWVSLALGLIGVVTPVLPTVPFIILASWAGMRSSRHVHHYLETHRTFGPVLRDWREYGAVRRRTKALATLSMAIGAVVLWSLSAEPLVPALVSGVMVTIAIWLWLRPEPPVWR